MSKSATIPSLKTVAFFEEKTIRRERYNDEWRFSIVDIVSILTQSSQASRYWRELKDQLAKYEGYSDLFGKIEKLKFLALDGKMRPGDAGNTETLLRIIQSIPSPKAEPFKQRLASLGNQRVEEVNDPELGIQRAKARALEVYRSRGMTEKEIKQRFQDIDIRNDYTDELKSRGIKDGLEYALLTNISYQWSGKTAQEYKEHKGLTKNDNLRDHMTRTEMLLTGLSEEAGTEIARTRNAKGFNEIQTALVEGAEVAKQAKEVLEEKTGKPVVNSHNRLTPRQQALRDRAYAQQKLGYNKKNK